MKTLAKIGEVLKVAAVILLLPIIIPIMIVAKFVFGNKANVQKDEVLGFLRRMEAGEIDDYWWDDFLNVPIKNAELDELRERCDELWQPGSGYLDKSPENGEYYLNERGLVEIRSLIDRCERIVSNTSSEAVRQQK